MIYPIYIYGSGVLRKDAEDIPADYPGLKELCEDMFETMYDSDGVGLAAPQIGKSIRLFVIDASPFAEDDEPELKDFRKIFINARIYERFGEEVPFNEGCLSLPGIREDVMRPSKIKIRYMDENFTEHDEEYEGTAARIIQHEYDHLDGKMFVDRLSPLRKTLIKSKLTKLSKGNYKASYRCKLVK